MEHGLIPKHVDVTQALVGDLGVLQQKPARFHDYKDQFVQTFIASGRVADVGNLKLDLNSPVKGAVADGIATNTAVDVTPRLNFQTAKFFSGDEEMVSMDKFMNPSKESDTEFQREGDDYDLKKARGFNELLDMYSLHQFLIRHGNTLESTPEFVSFRRKYSYMWGQIIVIIKKVWNLHLQLREKQLKVIDYHMLKFDSSRNY